VDLKIYGPYKKEDIGSLPKQNAQALIKQGAAKSIDIT
jgi:DNA replication initiation complex subunit (GINS family)